MLKIFVVLADTEDAPVIQYDENISQLQKRVMYTSDIVDNLPVEKNPSCTQNHIPLSLVDLRSMQKQNTTKLVSKLRSK